MPALKFGEAIHLALPLVLQGTMDKALAAFDSVWQDATCDADDKRNRGRAMAMLLSFAEANRPGYALYTLLDPPAGCLPIDDRISPWEVPFAIDVGAHEMMFAGRLDGMGKHRDTGDLWGVEFKTVSVGPWQKLSDVANNMQGNPQIVGGTLALRVLTGLPIKGVMLTMLQVDKKTTCTSTQPLHVTDAEVEAFIHSLRYTAAQVKACEQTGDFPCEFSGCATYSMFGTTGFVCDYYRLCHMVSDWTILRGTYEVRERKPFILTDEQLKGAPRAS